MNADRKHLLKEMRLFGSRMTSRGEILCCGYAFRCFKRQRIAITLSVFFLRLDDLYLLAGIISAHKFPSFEIIRGNGFKSFEFAPFQGLEDFWFQSGMFVSPENKKKIENLNQHKLY